MKLIHSTLHPILGFIESALNLHIFQIDFSLQPLIYLENGAIFIQAPSAVKKWPERETWSTLFVKKGPPFPLPSSLPLCKYHSRHRNARSKLKWLQGSFGVLGCQIPDFWEAATVWTSLWENKKSRNYELGDIYEKAVL